MNLRSLTLPLLGVVVLFAVLYSEILARPIEKNDGRVHITYWEKWTDFEAKAMADVVKAYNESQNHIYVDYLTISNIESKTLMAIAAKQPPDVAGLYAPNLAKYADNAAVMALDDYCRKFGIRADQYIPAYWNFTYYHNHIYGLPTTPASTALYYNKAMLREAGLDPEKPPRTVEDMQAMADKLTVRNGDRIEKAGFIPAEPGWWNWGWGCIFGGKLWDGKSKITANSPENVRAFEWVQWWSKRFGPGAMQTFRQGFGNFSSPQNAYLSSEVAMELQGVWMYNYISKFSPKLEWGAVRFPYPADRPDLANSTFVDEDIIVIPSGARHPDEAFDFIRFVQSQKGMEMLCLGQRKHTPLRQASPEFYAKHPNPLIRLFADMPKSKNTISPPKMGVWDEYQSEMTNAFDEMTVNGKPPKAALDYVQVRMQSKLDNYLAKLARQRQAEGGQP